MNTQRKVGAVLGLGGAQTLAWASSYYLPAILAHGMARDLGVGVPWIFGAFSCALLVSALPGPLAGRAIDRFGGRPVLLLTNLVFALGLVLLSRVRDLHGLFLAWAVIGLAMGAGLYEAAFAALVKRYGADSRGAITGITLIAGFASTVGWPLTAYLEARLGWRTTCEVWAGLHLVLGLPLNALIGSAATRAQPSSTKPERAAAGHASQGHRSTLALLSFVFAATWFISTAMAAHLPRLLQICGLGAAAAVGIGALVGPAQVAGRLLEFGLLRHVHPLLSARLAALGHPIGMASLLVLGPLAAPAFALLHGAGNGILTIAKGTLPLVLFGAEGYGARQGWLMLPARCAQAAAPFVFGFALERLDLTALWLSGGLGVLVLLALLMLRSAHSRQ